MKIVMANSSRMMHPVKTMTQDQTWDLQQILSSQNILKKEVSRM